jgi:hypothetical protein
MPTEFAWRNRFENGLMVILQDWGPEDNIKMDLREIGCKGWVVNDIG